MPIDHQPALITPAPDLWYSNRWSCVQILGHPALSSGQVFMQNYCRHMTAFPIGPEDFPKGVIPGGSAPLPTGRFVR